MMPELSGTADPATDHFPIPRTSRTENPLPESLRFKNQRHLAAVCYVLPGTYFSAFRCVFGRAGYKWGIQTTSKKAPNFMRKSLISSIIHSHVYF